MKRVTLFCGHYGSGKSNIAVNYAFRLRETCDKVALADVDVVNPYFRSLDSKSELEEKGIRVIALPFANTNVDLPALPSEVYGLVERRDIHAVLDVGGDDRGALALGRFVPYIQEENDYDMFFVANFYRPLTRTATEALGVMNEIFSACRLPFTGIINNSNLGEETVARDVVETVAEAEKLAEISGLPLIYTTYSERLGEINVPSPFPIRLQKKNF